MTARRRHPIHVPAVVVGAGPAGMAAALELAALGIEVVVLDTYAAPGGQFHRGPAPGLAQPSHPRAGSITAFEAAVRRGEITLYPNTTVWTATVMPAAAAFRLELTGAGRPLDAPATVHAEAVVLATGAFDRVLPFPGHELPGVFTAGGAQALLKGQGVRIGRRVVVAGSGPFLLPVAAALLDADVEVAALTEAQSLRVVAREAPSAWDHRHVFAEAAGYAQTLLRHRVRPRFSTAVTEAAGDGRLEQITLHRLDGAWRPIAGTETTVAADAACVSFGFVPQLGLAGLLGCRLAPDPAWGDASVVVDTDQHTSVPGVFAAGETTGVTGAPGSAAEGAIAGRAAARYLGASQPAARADRDAEVAARRARGRQRRLSLALGRMYRRPDGWLEWLRDDTLICRCEEVGYQAVTDAVQRLGARDLRSVKLVTRCGMGRCQGRSCAEAVTTILMKATGYSPGDLGALSTPTVLAPVPLGDLAALATDADPTGQPHPPTTAPTADTQLSAHDAPTP